MTKCKLCGNETNGSIGAAGLEWAFLCQQCKDKEDVAALDKLKGTPKYSIKRNINCFELCLGDTIVARFAFETNDKTGRYKAFQDAYDTAGAGGLCK